jgi:hypothetical protein
VIAILILAASSVFIFFRKDTSEED